MQRSVFSTGAASAVPRRVSDRAVQTDLQRKTRLQAFWKNSLLTEPMISLTLLFFFFQKELYQKKTETSLIFLPQTRLGSRNILPLSKRGNELLCRPTPVTHRLLGAARSILAQPPSAAVLSQACASSTAPGLQANERFIARWVRHTYALRPLGDRRSSSESSQSKIKAQQMLIFLNIVPVLHCISCSAASRQNPGPVGLWGVDPLQKGSTGHWGQPYSRGYEQPFGVTFILSWCAILFSLAFLDYQGTTPGVPSPRPRGDVTQLTKSALWWPRSLKSSRIITDYLCVTYANSQKMPCHVSSRGAVCFSAGTTWSPGRFLLTSHHLQSP